MLTLGPTDTGTLPVVPNRPRVSRTLRFSERLGDISDDQLQLALDRFGLGTLSSAAPVTAGLFGQNLFLTSTGGQYVLRGKPHYDWQFPSEQFFVRLLADRTGVPVPHPYQVDQSTDIFGWSYVLMPRLSGIQLSDKALDPTFGAHDLEQIALAQAMLLLEAQKLIWPHYGRYDLASGTIEPCAEPYSEWLFAITRKYLLRATSYNTRTTHEDLAWVEAQFDNARPALLQPFQPCFAMHDFNPSNMLLENVDNTWHITGLFDLMEAHFGHGESDLSRMFCFYVDAGRSDLARLFTATYYESVGRPAGFLDRFAAFVIHDRAVVWEWLQRTRHVPEAAKPASFKNYVTSFVAPAGFPSCASFQCKS